VQKSKADMKDIDSFRMHLIQYLTDKKLILHEKNIGLLFYFIFKFTILLERIMLS
jgi:hypothetical protein